MRYPRPRLALAAILSLSGGCATSYDVRTVAAPRVTLTEFRTYHLLPTPQPRDGYLPPARATNRNSRMASLDRWLSAAESCTRRRAIERRDMCARAYVAGTTRTEHGAVSSNRSATFGTSDRMVPAAPCTGVTMRSALTSRANDSMASAGSPAR